MTCQNKTKGSRPCQCPYCSGEVREKLPFCEVCGAMIVRCLQCGKVLEQAEVTCPTCGAPVEKEQGAGTSS